MPINGLLFTLLACVLLFPLLLAAYQRLAEKRDLQRHPPPGRLLATDNRQLHVRDQGASGPAVLFESGLAASSISWVTTTPLLGFARVVTYDRAGLGWSEFAPTPPSLFGILADLQAVILLLQLQTPVILVGHSFGALIVRALAHRSPRLVAGLVLIDPVSLNTYADPHPHVRKMLSIGAGLSERGALLARFAIVRAALWLALNGSRRLPAFIGRVSAGRGNSVLKRLAAEVSKLPSDTHAPISSHWCRPASFKLMAHYLRLLPQAAQQARSMPVPTDIPLVILSAASATPAELAEREAWVQGRPFSRHSQIPDTTHWLMLDRPDVIAEAVRQLAS